MALIKDPKSKKIIEEIISFLEKVDAKIPKGTTLGEVLPQTLIDAGPKNIKNMQVSDLLLESSGATGTVGSAGAGPLAGKVRTALSKTSASKDVVKKFSDKTKFKPKGNVPAKTDDVVLASAQDFSGDLFTAINPATGNPFISDTMLKRIDPAKLEAIRAKYGRNLQEVERGTSQVAFENEVRNLAREETNKILTPILKKNQEKALDKGAGKWGVDRDVLKKEVEKIVGRDLAGGIARKGQVPRGAKWAIGIGVPSLWLYGTNQAAWAAVDNVNTNIAMNVRKIDELVTFSSFDPDTALEMVEEQEKILSNSERVINLATGANPVTWVTGQRKAYLLAVEAQRDNIDLIKTNINIISQENSQALEAKSDEAQSIRDQQTIDEQRQAEIEQLASQGILSGEGITLEDTRDIRERDAAKGGSGEIIIDPVTGRKDTRANVQQKQQQREQARKEAAQRRSRLNKPRTTGGSNIIRTSNTPIPRDTKKKISGLL